MLSEVVTDEGLTTVFIYALEDLVAGGIPKAGEEGGEFRRDRGRGIFSEDD